MKWFKSETEEEKKELLEEMGYLKDDKKELEEEIERLKSKAKIAEEEILHNVKIKEEKLDIEFKQKEQDVKSKYHDKEMAMEKEFNVRVRADHDKEMTRLENIYKDLVKRLPDVNMTIEQTNKKG